MAWLRGLRPAPFPVGNLLAANSLTSAAQAGLPPPSSFLLRPRPKLSRLCNEEATGPRFAPAGVPMSHLWAPRPSAGGTAARHKSTSRHKALHSFCSFARPSKVSRNSPTLRMRNRVNANRFKMRENDFYESTKQNGDCRAPLNSVLKMLKCVFQFPKSELQSPTGHSAI